MQKIIIYIIFFLSICVIVNAQESNLELGVRYLKLGNTYLKSENFEQSLTFLTEGQKLVKGKSKYWEAVSYEYLGYYYNEAEDNKEKAIDYLNKAQLIYKELLGQKDGSQYALESVLDMIQYLNSDNSLSDVKNDEMDNNPVTIKKSDNKVLNYEHQKLRELPSEIQSNVENLSLAENKFREFPASLQNFKNLEYLNLENNKIKTIPNTIGNLKKLKYLNISNNGIKELPVGISELKNLKVLDIKGNKIPFEDISNLIRIMPNTNILFDEYILKPKKGSEILDENLESEEEVF